MSDMEEDEDYGFEYETDDDEEQDVDIENQVRNLPPFSDAAVARRRVAFQPSTAQIY